MKISGFETEFQEAEDEIYRYEATSISGFIQQIAVSLLPYGYHFYVRRVIPQSKNVQDIDRKLLLKYGIPMSRSARFHRRRAGLGNVHYIRYKRTFLLLADSRPHLFHREEAANIRDIREEPLSCFGYLIRFRGSRQGCGHSSVQLNRHALKELKEQLLSHAFYEKAALERIIFFLPYEPYRGVLNQVRQLIALINQKRRAARLEPISRQCRFHRMSLSPFQPISGKRLNGLARYKLPGLAEPDFPEGSSPSQG